MAENYPSRFISRPGFITTKVLRAHVLRISLSPNSGSVPFSPKNVSLNQKPAWKHHRRHHTEAYNPVIFLRNYQEPTTVKNVYAGLYSSVPTTHAPPVRHRRVERKRRHSIDYASYKPTIPEADVVSYWGSCSDDLWSSWFPFWTEHGQKAPVYGYCSLLSTLSSMITVPGGRPIRERRARQTRKIDREMASDEPAVEAIEWKKQGVDFEQTMVIDEQDGQEEQDAVTWDENARKDGYKSGRDDKVCEDDEDEKEGRMKGKKSRKMRGHLIWRKLGRRDRLSFAQPEGCIDAGKVALRELESEEEEEEEEEEEDEKEEEDEEEEKDISGSEEAGNGGSDNDGNEKSGDEEEDVGNEEGEEVEEHQNKAHDEKFGCDCKRRSKRITGSCINDVFDAGGSSGRRLVGERDSRVDFVGSGDGRECGSGNGHGHGSGSHNGKRVGVVDGGGGASGLRASSECFCRLRHAYSQLVALTPACFFLSMLFLEAVKNSEYSAGTKGFQYS
ncbi:hypothetical protein BDZ91DRAFT_808067 [Kalaharituber pfeilii]|nr:hypothetical protein BDZ91DRAFT_808067 [Kalaharituber pfeilii]